MLNSGKNRRFLSHVTLKFDGWPWKTIGHLLDATSSFLHHFIAISEFKLELQIGNAQSRSKLAIFCPEWPWNLTDDLKNKKAPLLGHIKLCASFHRNTWIQTGVMGQILTAKLSFDLVTVTSDLWLWSFAWTSLLSMKITPENFMMMRT